LGFNRVIAASLALALTLAGLTGAFLYSHWHSQAHARYWVAHTHKVIEQNQILLALAQDIQAGAHGYLITEDPDALTVYRRAATAIPGAEARLTLLVADNSPEAGAVRALNRLVSQRLAFLARVVAVERAGDLAAARAEARVGAGLRTMTRIREQAAAISVAENRLLETRESRADDEDRTNLLMGLAVGALALVGLIALIFSLDRANSLLGRTMREAMAAREAREASEAIVRALFANSPDYLFVLGVGEDDRFLIEDINPAFERALNVEGETIRGRAVNDLLPPQSAEPIIAHYRRVRAADAPVTTRDLVPGLPQGPRTWESILAPVRAADGTTVRIVGSVRDITDRVKTAARLLDSQRMEAIGQLTGGMAHDFNNLLQVVRGNLEMLEPVVAGDERAAGRLRNAILGADRAAQLTRQLLAFARRQPLEPQAINLSRLVVDMADLLRRTLGEGVEVETVIGGGLWNTMADPAQVESAILNLAINARHAMPDGGRLTVEVTNASLDDAYVRDTDGIASGQYVLIAVSDTGQGMAPEIAARAFEPFFSTKAEGQGSGLGLSMVHGFVHQSGGHARIYSEVGQGTTVKVYLPRTRQSVKTTAPAVASEALGANETILVVEDEAGVRAAAIDLLEGLGYRCIEASDAETAIHILREAGVRVDLVFSDVVMPGPLKTRAFAEQVAALPRAPPILFTSGYTENAIVHHGRLDDGTVLLSKPYTRADLAAKVAQLLATPGVVQRQA